MHSQTKTRAKVPVLISIVSTNDGAWLTKCLNSLAPIRDRATVVVVANDCTDETEEICARAPLSVTVLKTHARLGFSECNNLCFLKAQQEGYEYIYLLNPDTQLQPGALESLLHFMESHSEFGIVGSIQIEYGDDTWSQFNEWSRLTLDDAARLGTTEQSAGGSTWLEHYYVQGAALMMRMSLARKIGLLDPAYVTFYEETDLCRRSLLAGKKVAILMNSRVQHFGGGNWKTNVDAHYKRDRLMLRNRFLYTVSGAESKRSMAAEALRVVVHGMKTVWFKREDVILSPWQYSLVLWSIVLRWKDILRLYRRNQIIRSGGYVPESLRQVGPERKTLVWQSEAS